MASPVIQALEKALYVRSGHVGIYWAMRSPNPDHPPMTFRLHRRSGNGWALLLAASKETGDVLSFYVESDADRQAVLEALKWLGISGRIEDTAAGPVLQAGGKAIPSARYGGEKPKAAAKK